MRRLIVLGAGGVFGTLLSRELRGEVIGASRATGADLRDPESIARVARGAFAVLCAAGPFQSFDPRCVRAAAEEGAHWLDIADDPSWFFALLDDRALDAYARERGVAIVPGLSTLPAISGMLVRQLAGASPDRPSPRMRIAVTLGIGNRNGKGPGAIASVMGSDGRTILTPDRELFAREGIDVETFVKFQLPGAAMLLRLAKRLGVQPAALSRLAQPFSRIGTDASYVEAVSATAKARIDARGQRLAILPAAAVANRLIEGAGLRGVLAPSDAISDDELLRTLRDAGAVASGALRTSDAAPA